MNKEISIEIVKDILKKENLEVIDDIGRGSFGVVASVKNTRTNYDHAVKMVFGEYAEQEFKMWGLLKHPFLLPLQAVYTILDVSPKTHLYISPLLPHLLGAVSDNPEFRSKPLAFYHLRKWLKGILCGLDYMHRKDIAHLDIKADNILLNREYSPVICDFGFASPATPPTRRFGRPFSYTPPEACKTMGQNLVEPRPFDLWTYGMLALQLFTKHWINERLQPPALGWARQNYVLLRNLLKDETLLDLIKSTLPEANIGDAEYQCFKNFVGVFLKIMPSERGSAAQALSHKFLGGSYQTTIDDLWINPATETDLKEVIKAYHKKLERLEYLYEDERLGTYSGHAPWAIVNDRKVVGRFINILSEEKLSFQKNFSVDAPIVPLTPVRASPSEESQESSNFSDGSRERLLNGATPTKEYVGFQWFRKWLGWLFCWTDPGEVS